MTFGNVDAVLCIFFHSRATGQDKVQMPRDSGKRQLYYAVNSETQKTAVHKGSDPLIQEEMYLSEFGFLFSSTLCVKVLTVQLYF